MGVRHGLRSYSASGNAFARTLTQRILHKLDTFDNRASCTRTLTDPRHLPQPTMPIART